MAGKEGSCGINKGVSKWEKSHKPEARSQKHPVRGSNQHPEQTKARTPETVMVKQENLVPPPEWEGSMETP